MFIYLLTYLPSQEHLLSQQGCSFEAREQWANATTSVAGSAVNSYRLPIAFSSNSSQITKCHLPCGNTQR